MVDLSWSGIILPLEHASVVYIISSSLTPRISAFCSCGSKLPVVASETSGMSSMDIRLHVSEVEMLSSNDFNGLGSNVIHVKI